MGESACLLEPFSYMSGSISEAKEGNPAHALGESISFGRFASESLDWERWSSFSRNRHVEEAKKYSQPGSVKEKKAFFEAHYKSIAAKKAAALLEQENANAAANNVPRPECGVSHHDPIPENSGAMLSISTGRVDKQLQVQAPATKADSPTGVIKNHSNVADGNFTQVKEVDLVTQIQPTKAGETQQGDADYVDLEANEPSATAEVPTLEVSDEGGSASKITVPSSKSSVNGASRLPPTPPAKPKLHLRKENIATTNIYYTHQASTLMGKAKSAGRFKASVSGAPSRMTSPAKPKGAVQPRSDVNATPVSIRSTLDSWDRKRSTPKALHIAVSKTPRSEHKIKSSRVCNAASGTTPLGTPTTAPVNVKDQLSTPLSESRRAKTPLHPMPHQRRIPGPKWQPSPDHRNQSTPTTNKSYYPILSSPFSFKTEERAMKRKEKLEERLNAKEAHKVQAQTKFKEKAESEIRKLRQTLCFKARPLPDFYKERRTPKDQTKKGAEKLSQSPKRGIKHCPSIVQGTPCLPPRKPSTSCSSKVVLQKNGETLFSLTNAVAVENTSPNIQQ